MMAWPTTQANTVHTANNAGSKSRARPEIHRAIQNQNAVQDTFHARNARQGDILAWNTANSAFVTTRNSALPRFKDHPLPTVAQLSLVASDAPYNIQATITPNFLEGGVQLFKGRGGVQNTPASITTTVANSNAQQLNINVPTNMENGQSMRLFIQNVTPQGATPAQNPPPLRLKWNSKYLHANDTGLTYIDTARTTHDIQSDGTIEFSLFRASANTVLVQAAASSFSVRL